MTAHTPDNALDAIRREIDVIDDQVLDLLERRFAATRRVKATKASDGSIASSPFRPAREAAMLRRFGGAFAFLRAKPLDTPQQQACGKKRSERSSGRAHGNMISQHPTEAYSGTARVSKQI